MAIAAAVYFLPTQLVKRDLGNRLIENLSEEELLTAKNAVRTTLLQGLAGGLLFVGLYFTYRTIQVSREGQITDRFTRSIDQLGDEKLDVRIGGIYALERIAKDSGADHRPVMEVLAAFLREHSAAEQERNRSGAPSEEAPSEVPRARADLQAAAEVIGRRNALNDVPGSRIYLSRVRLPRANLENADFNAARLRNADFRRADLEGANFREARLRGTDFRGANLVDADLRGANLDGARLQGARASENTMWPVGFDAATAGVSVEVSGERSKQP